VCHSLCSLGMGAGLMTHAAYLCMGTFVMVTVEPSCRAGVDLLQQLYSTLCAALATMQTLCHRAVQFMFIFYAQLERDLGSTNLKLLHLQSHSCQVLLGTGCRISLLVLSLLQACVLHQAPPSALARLTGLCLILRHTLKACTTQQVLRCYHPEGC